MSGYINFKRDFFKSDLYRTSSCGQREVFLALVIRVNYESRIIDFGGKRRVLDLGQIWFSRRKLLEALSYSGVKDSTIRNGVKKLVQKGFLTHVTSSRSGGSIYQCTAKFYNEISEPFDLKKVQILRPTNDQRTTNEATNERPTNDQPKTLTINELRTVATNERPTNDQRTTNERPTNSLITLNNSITHKLNNSINGGNGEKKHHFKNNDFEFKNSLKKEKEDFSKRKKVAAKKEKVFNIPPALESHDPIDIYFDSNNNLEYWQKRFPGVDVPKIFGEIKEALFRKAGKGNYQNGNFYSYVLKVLENRKREMKQEETGKKLFSKKRNENGISETIKGRVSDFSTIKDSDRCTKNRFVLKL